ncbi:MAG: hypothetical protein GY839_18010 [candidate division Zixibacteria bacterium]|nr:hypothetical protein [candidate division Zixibacteria bacterium]
MNPSKKTKITADLFESLPGKPVWYYFSLYLIMVILLFRETLFSPSNFLYGSDLIEAGGVFFRTMLIDYFRVHFTWPLWDPFIHGGMPFVDGMHGEIFYMPSFIIYMIFKLSFAWGFILALHVFLAGIFMYMFLKEIKIRGMVAFLGGLMYMMAPFLISLVYAGHNGKIFIIALTPLILFIYHRAFTRTSLFYYILLAIIIFLGITTSHMQMAYFMFFMLGIYFITTTIQRWRLDKINPLKPTLLFSAAVGLGLIMASMQFVTPYQYLQKYSMRTIRTQSENKYEYATSWSMNYEEVGANFFPEFCGDNIKGQPTTYWGPNYFKLNSEHFSIIALFLAILGIGLWQRRGKWFFFWTIVIATLYALGANTPAFRIFYLIPGVKSFRAPGMINFLVGFSAITLACMGLESFLQAKKSDQTFKKTWRIYTYISIGYSFIAFLVIILQMGFFKIWFAIFGTPDAQKTQVLQMGLDTITIGAVISLIAVLGLYFLLKFYRDKKIKAGLIITALALFTIIYMWYFNSRYFISFDPRSNYAKTPVVDFLQSKQAEEQFRVFVMPQTLRDYYLAYHGIEELSFTILHGNHLATFEKLAGQRAPMAGLIYQPIQDLLNAKYIVSAQQLPPQYFKPDRFRMIKRAGNLLVYENLTALPRAFPMYRYTVIEDEDRIIAMLSDTTFDYRSTVIFEEIPDNPPPDYDDSLQFAVVPARIFDSELNQFRVDVEMIEDGFLFLSENYYPAWRAYENGNPLTTLKANYNFRAIPLKKGSHTIECKFENSTYTATFAISKITFILMLLGLIGLAIKDRIGRPKD